MLVLAGCGSSDFAPSSNVYFKPWVGVIQVTDKLPDRYIPIGVITAHGSWDASDATLLQQLKERAAGVGANVIVLQGGRTRGEGSSFLMPDYQMTALAIRTVQ